MLLAMELRYNETIINVTLVYVYFLLDAKYGALEQVYYLVVKYCGKANHNVIVHVVQSETIRYHIILSVYKHINT